MLHQDGVALPQGGRCRRHLANQFLQHARVLRALAGKQEGNSRARANGFAVKDPLLLQQRTHRCMGGVRRGHPDLRGQRSRAVCHHGKTRAIGGNEPSLPGAAEERLYLARGLAESSQQVGLCGGPKTHNPPIAFCRRGDRRRSRPWLRLDRRQLVRGTGSLGRLGRGHAGRALENGVVGESFGARHDGGQPATLRLAEGQGHPLRCGADDPRIVGQDGSGGLQAHGSRHLALLDRQTNLQERCHCRRSLGVANLPDQRANKERLGAVPAAVGADNRTPKLLVAFRQAGAVHLNRGDVGGMDSGDLERPLYGQSTACLPRRIVGRADPADDGPDAVAVAPGVRKTLEQEHADAFARDEPLRLGVQRRTGTLGGGEDALVRQRFVHRQPHAALPGRAEHHVAVGAEKQVHAHAQGRQP